MYFNFLLFMYSCEVVNNIHHIQHFQQLEGTFFFMYFSCLCYLLTFCFTDVFVFTVLSASSFEILFGTHYCLFSIF